MFTFSVWNSAVFAHSVLKLQLFVYTLHFEKQYKISAVYLLTNCQLFVYISAVCLPSNLSHFMGKVHNEHKYSINPPNTENLNGSFSKFKKITNFRWFWKRKKDRVWTAFTRSKSIGASTLSIHYIILVVSVQKKYYYTLLKI